MLENLIYAQKKSLLTKELEAGNVPENAIAFIEDTKLIYALGLYFAGGYTKEEIDIKIGNINTILESIISGGSNIITFTIGNVEYQAEEGMTWEQWVSSKYNTEAFYIHNNMYIVDSVYLIYDVDTDKYVNPSDIIKNINYLLGTEPSIIGPS